MYTIIPTPKNALREVQALLDSMLDATGGDSGRSFTPEEKVAWKALLKVRDTLHEVQEARVRDHKASFTNWPRIERCLPTAEDRYLFCPITNIDPESAAILSAQATARGLRTFVDGCHVFIARAGS